MFTILWITAAWLDGPDKIGLASIIAGGGASNQLLLWITLAVLGAATVLIASFGLLPAILFAALLLVLFVRGDHPVGLIGLLTGFGALWTFLIVRQLSSEGVADNVQFWLAVGVVPLVIGCGILALDAVRGRRRPKPTART